MIYLTYNDAPSGIYSSQVIDVCKYLNQDLNAKVRLVSIISIRDFFAQRKKIKKQVPKAIVLPMFPKLAFWRWNLLWLWFFKTDTIIARGVFACNMALILRNRKKIDEVIFDARGAYHAELTEYEVTNSQKVIEEIRFLERQAVQKSNYRIAVSQELVKYWRAQYEYNGENQVVIPCTLNSTLLNQEVKMANRKDYGYGEEDVLLIYAGSTAGWQSLEMLESLLADLMTKDEKVKILFLIPQPLNILKEFGSRVQQKWLPHEEVLNYLSLADYGILIREDTVTNKVASPTKFAEYLLAGLNILISDNIGDYSTFVKEKSCGQVVGTEELALKRTSGEEREKNRSLAKEYFTKENYKKSYQQLIA